MNRNRLNEIRRNLELLYQQKNGIETALILAPLEEQIRLRQKIQVQISPEIEKYEQEYWKIIADQSNLVKIPEAEVVIAEFVERVGQLQGQNAKVIEYLHKILVKVEEPNSTSVAKLTTIFSSIPPFVGIAIETELDLENFLSRHFPTLMKVVQGLNKVIGQDVSSAQQEEIPSNSSSAQQQEETPQNSSSKTILVLASIPTDEARLRLDQEVREIDEGLTRSRNRENFTLNQSWAVRPDDLRRALLNFCPQILHFCGHGSGENGLVLQNEAGEAKLVSTEALANLLKRFADRGLECVVLNACYSEVQARAIAEHIDYVIGMDGSIGDRAAIKFALGFYDELGAGWSYEDAFHGGCDAIALEGIEEEHKPILKRKSQIKKPSFFNEPNSQTPQTTRNRPKPRETYEQLSIYLAQENWKEADKETMQILLRIADTNEKRGRLKPTQKGWLTEENVKKIPIESLQKINNLWLAASDSKFGYSVQKQIWLDVTQVESIDDSKVRYNVLFGDFADQVGWQVDGHWLLSYDSFDFSLNAPDGHLPTFWFPYTSCHLDTQRRIFKFFLSCKKFPE